MSEIIIEKPQNIIPNPWRRYLARMFDLWMYSLIIGLFQLFIMRWNTQGQAFIYVLEAIFAGFVMVLIEPLLLSKIGTTPGKWVFGLVLRNENNEKMDYLDGLWRTYTVFKLGMGFSIPIYNLVRLMKSYSTCESRLAMDWDEEFTYTIKDVGGLRILAYIGSVILTFALSFLIIAQASLPIHRGNITPQEYYENCNDFIKYNNISLDYKMNEKGHWIKKSSNYGNIISLTTKGPLNHQVIYNNGQIQKIILEVETADEEFISSYSDQLFMAYDAFVGSQKSVSIFKLNNQETVDLFINSFDNFEFIKGDIKVTNEVDFTGYTSASRFLIPIEDVSQSFHLRFIMERQ